MFEVILSEIVEANRWYWSIGNIVLMRSWSLGQVQNNLYVSDQRKNVYWANKGWSDRSGTQAYNNKICGLLIIVTE